MLNKNHQEVHQEMTKKQEFKHIGSTRRKKGLKLFAKNPDNSQVYEVTVNHRKVIDMTSKTDKGAYKAVVNPSHKTLWAVNMKNALRKFNR